MTSIKLMDIEERLYRLRCVEAWAMAVPWTGFSLKALLDIVEPKSNATHVAMTTFYKPFTAQGQLAFWRPLALYRSTYHRGSNQRTDFHGSWHVWPSPQKTTRCTHTIGSALEIRV